MGKLDINKTINNNYLLYILSLFGYFIILGVLLIYYFTERNMSNYVHHTNCYAPVSDYTVEPGKSSTSFLQNCGPNKNNLCCHTSTSLLNAINYVQINKGRKFTYNEGTKQTCIIDPTNTKYTTNPQSSVYTMVRYNINQGADGTTKKEVEKSFDTSPSTNTVGVVALRPTNRSVIRN